MTRVDDDGLSGLAVSVDNYHVAQLENFRLKVFRTVAEHLNFRKAAEHLFLTQPAITLQIKALEDDLGVRLFDRTANRVSLTPQGSLLLGYAKKIATLVSQAEQELGGQDGKVSGELSLGVSTTIAQYVLPRLLVAFLDEHPRVQFSLHSGNTGEIVQLLLDDKLSIGLIEGPARDRGIRTEPFMQDELVLITPPAFESDHMSRDQLVASNLLMREHGSGSRRVVEIALEKAGFKLKSFKKSDEPGFHRSDQVRSGSRTRHRLRFALGDLKRAGTGCAEGCGGCRSKSHAPFFPHFAHRPGTARPGGRVPNVRARACPASRQHSAKTDAARALPADKLS